MQNQIDCITETLLFSIDTKKDPNQPYSNVGETVKLCEMKPTLGFIFGLAGGF